MTDLKHNLLWLVIVLLLVIAIFLGGIQVLQIEEMICVREPLQLVLSCFTVRKTCAVLLKRESGSVLFWEIQWLCNCKHWDDCCCRILYGG